MISIPWFFGLRSREASISSSTLARCYKIFQVSTSDCFWPDVHFSRIEEALSVAKSFDLILLSPATIFVLRTKRFCIHQMGVGGLFKSSKIDKQIYERFYYHGSTGISFFPTFALTSSATLTAILKSSNNTSVSSSPGATRT